MLEFNVIKTELHQLTTRVHNHITQNTPTVNITKHAVHNLATDYPLSDAQLVSLALGLNFIPIPKQNKNYQSLIMK